MTRAPMRPVPGHASERGGPAPGPTPIGRPDLRLREVTAADLDDAALIDRLGAWRAEHMAFYPTQFTVTAAGTHAWLRDRVVGDPARIMFLIETADGRPVGHLGFDHLRGPGVPGALSNFMVGDRAAVGPGAINACARGMLAWGYATLGLTSVTANPFLDNVPSVRMLRRLGFVEEHRVPLRRRVADGHVAFLPLATDDHEPADRVHVMMRHTPGRPAWPAPGLGPVGLGTAGTGPAGTDAAADRVRAATVERALDLGIDWIDTAAIYGLGHVEAQLGTLLEGMERDARPRVVTKCGLRWDTGTGRAVTSDPAGLRAEVEAALDRLRTDRLDVLLLHRVPTDPAALEAAWAGLAGVAADGLAGAIGLSDPTPEQLARCHAHRPVDAVQAPCSPARPDGSAPLRSAAATHRVPVIAHGALELGALAGALTPDRLDALGPADRRRRPAALDAEARARVDAALPTLRAIAHDAACTLPELAVAWTLAEPGVVAVAVGASTPKQVLDVASAGRVVLDTAQRAAVRAALA